MNQQSKQAICFIFTKINTAILLYFFFQFILVIFFHWNPNIHIFTLQQEKNNAFIFTFLIFYLIERILSLIIEISILKPKWWEMILFILLNPIQLEEVFFLLFRNRYQKYAKEGVQGQTLIITLFHQPLYIISTIWMQNHMSYLNSILQTMILIAFSLALFFSVITLIFRFEFFQNNQEFMYFAKPFFLAVIHFVTYVWLICINSMFGNFNSYFLTIHLILVVHYILKIQKLIKFNYQNKIKYYFALIGFTLKELFHVVIEPRNIDKQRAKQTLSKFGIKLFDRMVLYSFTIKLYLLLTFFIKFYQQLNLNQEIYSIYKTVLILSTISTLILGYSVFINTILPMIFGPTDLEFYDVKSFLNYKQNNFLMKKYKRLDMITIFEQTIQNNEKIDLIKLYFFSCHGSQIIHEKAQRENIEKEQNNISQMNVKNKTQKWQKIYFNFQIDTDEVLKIIGKEKLLPQIEEVDFQWTENSNIHKFYSSLVESNFGILFTTYEDTNSIKTLNNDYFYRIKQICAQQKAYDIFISKELLTNPLIIFYDLYDTLSE